MLKHALFTFLILISLVSFGQNFTLIYSFANITTSSGTVDPGPSPTYTGMSLSLFKAAGVSLNPNASGRFSFTSWPVGGLNGVDSYSSFTGSLAPQSYYEFSLWPVPGFTLDLKTLAFSIRRSSTGIRNYSVRCNLDTFATNLPPGIIGNSKLDVINDVFFWKYDSITTASDQKGSSVILDSMFRKRTDTLTFRFYAWNAEAKSGSFSLDNVTITGSAYDVIIPPNLEGIGINDATSPISVFPNPITDDHFRISGSYYESLQIYDINGKLVFHQEETDKNESYVVPFISPGVHFIKIKSRNGTIFRKVVID